MNWTIPGILHIIINLNDVWFTFWTWRTHLDKDGEPHVTYRRHHWHYNFNLKKVIPSTTPLKGWY